MVTQCSVDDEHMWRPRGALDEMSSLARSHEQPGRRMGYSVLGRTRGEDLFPCVVFPVFRQWLAKSPVCTSTVRKHSPFSWSALSGDGNVFFSRTWQLPSDGDLYRFGREVGMKIAAPVGEFKH